MCNNNECLLLLSIDPKTVHIIEPVPAPESVGEEAAALKTPSPGILSNFSFTNLKTEIKNIRLLKLFFINYYSTSMPFYHTRVTECANPRVLHCRP